MEDQIDLTATPPVLRGSRDPQTGETFFPPRALAVDGSLRDCEPVTLSRVGELYTWTRFMGTCFGQVDLPEGVRIQTPLCDGPHAIGAAYELVVGEGGAWSFRRQGGAA